MTSYDLANFDEACLQDSSSGDGLGSRLLKEILICNCFTPQKQGRPPLSIRHLMGTIGDGKGAILATGGQLVNDVNGIPAATVSWF